MKEQDSVSQYLRLYVYGPGIDELVCMKRIFEDTSEDFYYQYDPLGSVVALSGNQSMVLERYSYDAFGKPTIYDADGNIISQSAYGNRFMFTGREYDYATGNYYYRNRDYKPSIGCFLQTDPIGYYGGLNLHTYCRNNPLNWVDPWGEKTYKQRREIGGHATRPISRRIAHQFVFTTNPDGSVRNTYSWGNTYDKNGNGQWRKNRPEDRQAAKNGLKDGTAQQVGDDSLDPYTDKAYNEKTNDQPHEWEIGNQCQTESDDLVDKAKDMQNEDEDSSASDDPGPEDPTPPDPGPTDPTPSDPTNDPGPTNDKPKK